MTLQAPPIEDRRDVVLEGDGVTRSGNAIARGFRPEACVRVSVCD
jgi:hypothetical protein